MNVDSVSVVVIESQPLMLTALSTVLLTEGMTILAEVGESGQAIQSVQRFKPQIVLFSISSIPDLERISALRHEFPDVLILALVDGDYRGQKRMALDYGAHTAVTKAISRAELLRTITQLPGQPGCKTKIKPARFNAITTQTLYRACRKKTFFKRKTTARRML